MQQATGVVIAVQNDMATVRFARTDACGKCHACFRLGENEADIQIPNTLDARPGDVVGIELHEAAVFQASALMYGIPLCGLLLGVWLGSLFGDLYAALFGVLLAGGSFLLLHKLEPRFARMRRFKPRMVRMVEGEERS